MGVEVYGYIVRALYRNRTVHVDLNTLVRQRIGTLFPTSTAEHLSLLSGAGGNNNLADFPRIAFPGSPTMVGTRIVRERSLSSTGATSHSRPLAVPSSPECRFHDTGEVFETAGRGRVPDGVDDSDIDDWGCAGWEGWSGAAGGEGSSAGA